MDQTLDIAMIMGSAREHRFCDTVASWAAAEVEKFFKVAPRVVDPREQEGLSLAETSQAKERFQQKLGHADAMIIVVPEYNHSYPAAVKTVIDEAYGVWKGKPVGFVSYGGISGGLRAVEHLRQVIAELHGLSVRDSVSFASAWEQFDDEGRLKNPDRARSAMTRMLTQINWWGRHLKESRSVEPYPF
ncbi:NADPH-dependent FMN reductase [Hahella ganghwensis]|uniref:NADPH-dependent FMN reductase n=1 Tax=Hahella ganghwensis TaxID=286420 RepID=UPI00036D8B1B|nr:NAD(P)H-dependent oxidoreductase [Hahella ganghwensis]